MTALAPPTEGLHPVREAVQRLRRMGGERLASDMCAIFVHDLPGRLAAARAGVGGGNPRLVEHAAHAMKSSCGQLGAVAMQRLCATAEQLAHHDALDGVPELIDELELEFRLVRELLEREVRG